MVNMYGMYKTKKKRILKVSPIVFDLNKYVMGEAIYRKLG